MNRKRNPTMTDIARQIGVSRTTVSFVLNDLARDKGISVELEQKIKRIAKELNYRPSLVAKSLITQRTMTIGLILPNMEVSYGPALAENIETFAIQKGFHTLLCHHGENKSQLNNIINLMHSRQVEGLIIATQKETAQSSALRDVASSQHPLVFVEHDPEIKQINFVTTDINLCVKFAIDHLVKLGHHRIGFINASSVLIESSLRHKAFKECLLNHNISYDQNLHVYTAKKNYTAHTCAETRNMLDLPSPVTAVIAVSADRAINSYLTAETMGLKVPDDLSLVAITGQEFSDFHKTKITSIKLSYDATSKTAIRILLDAIESKEILPKRRVSIEPFFLDGKTTAPPA